MTCPVSSFIFQGKPVKFCFSYRYSSYQNQPFGEWELSPFQHWQALRTMKVGGGCPPKWLLETDQEDQSREKGTVFPIMTAYSFCHCFQSGAWRWASWLHGCHNNSPQPAWESQILFWELPPEWAGDDWLALLETASMVSPVNPAWGLTREEKMAS